MPKVLENAGLKVGMAFIHLKKTHTKSWAICNSSVMKNFHKGSCTFHVVDSLHAQIWEILTSRGKKESCLSVIINIYQVIFSFFIIFFFTDSKLTEDNIMLPFIVGHCREHMLPTSVSNMFHFPQQNKAPKNHEGKIS